MNRQTQSIETCLLPVLPDAPIPFAKKADLALAFCPHHPQVETVLNEVYRSQPGMSLSQMTDAYTSTVALACGIEVKETGGDYNEAVMQLGVWCAAGLEKIRSMRRAGVEQTLLQPLLGWTVIGHEWKLHIAWKEIDGNVVSPACGLIRARSANFIGRPWSLDDLDRGN